MSENDNKDNDIKSKLVKLKIDFLKLEYEKCIDAYLDIYNSIWKIFSYMSAIAAAMIIFSKDFPLVKWPFVILIASAPLVFWYVGIYLPMNRYGEQRLKTLKEITDNINSMDIDDIPNLCYFTKFKESKSVLKAFCSAKHWWKLGEYTRVKYFADLIGRIMLLVFVFMLVKFFISIISQDYSYFFKSSSSHWPIFPY